MLIEFNGEIKDVVDYYAETLIKSGNAKKVELKEEKPKAKADKKN